ncbi:orotidine-5'-phosphate decarboxylase [Candidatus Falkowbacteria bacterium]|nr:orotidine-5'-phosphate decarboxylase [Candidatus Falkowbacteria bacterium]
MESNNGFSQDQLAAARGKVILSLDVPSYIEAITVMKLLSEHVGMVKIGKELFTTCGPEIIRVAIIMGLEVFLDLKYHDIPNTVASACCAAARHGVKFINVHALGGPEMMTEAVEAMKKEFGENRPKLLAVTILTSSTRETLKAIGINESPEDMVIKLALLAKKCGLDGVVCSPKETEIIRAVCGDGFLIVNPGVRPDGTAANDQKRIATPGGAIMAGADYLVVGRPILKAEDQAAAADAIVLEVCNTMFPQITYVQ